jgi:hypothetical protein
MEKKVSGSGGAHPAKRVRLMWTHLVEQVGMSRLRTFTPVSARAYILWANCVLRMRVECATSFHATTSLPANFHGMPCGGVFTWHADGFPGPQRNYCRAPDPEHQGKGLDKVCGYCPWS